MSSPEFQIYCGRGVADVFREFDRMMQAAREWAAGAKWADDMEVNVLEDADQWRDKYNEVQGWVTEMELSFYRNLLQLINVGAGTGGLKLYPDSKNSLFFQEPASGYHGAMIFFPRLHNGVRLPVGSYSTHT